MEPRKLHAARGQLSASRLAPLFLTVQRNREWWTSGPLLSSGRRVGFEGSQIVWQYYPGNGIQTQASTVNLDIGGTTIGQGNVIGGFAIAGIRLNGAFGTSPQIAGDGTSAAGALDEGGGLRARKRGQRTMLRRSKRWS